MHAKLEVLSGAKTRELTVRLPTVIGRGGDARLKLPASTVSRLHCEVYEFDGQVAVRDLNSANGTFVNGHKISAPTFLGGQDELMIGPVTLRLSAVAADDGAAPSSASILGHQERLPELADLCRSEDVPVTAQMTSRDAATFAEATDESVLRYAEPKDSGHSFLDIDADDQGVGELQLPAVDDAGPAETAVSPDDPALQEFLKKLDG